MFDFRHQWFENCWTYGGEIVTPEHHGSDWLWLWVSSWRVFCHPAELQEKIDGIYFPVPPSLWVWLLRCPSLFTFFIVFRSVSLVFSLSLSTTRRAQQSLPRRSLRIQSSQWCDRAGRCSVLAVIARLLFVIIGNSGGAGRRGEPLTLWGIHNVINHTQRIPTDTVWVHGSSQRFINHDRTPRAERRKFEGTQIKWDF